MIQAFYPSSTYNIIHKGKKGNIYHLDGIEKCNSLMISLKNIKQIQIKNVNSTKKSNIKLGVELINEIHDSDILESYKSGIPIDLANSSGLMWQPQLFNFVIEQALTSKLVTDSALKNCLSIAITGGGHHAQRSRPYGFCPINTIAISAIYAQKLGYKVAIVDLDTHYSNGCIDILRNKQNIFLLSLWNQKLDKWKYTESKGNIWHKEINDEQDYFQQLDKLILELEKIKPSIIIYHLGLDVLGSDRMGGINNMSIESVIKRDTILSKYIKDKLKSKIVIFIGGSYIDHSKGLDNAEKQRSTSTNLLVQLISMYE